MRKGAGSGKATLVIHTDHASKEIQELGEDESYILEITYGRREADGANASREPCTACRRFCNWWRSRRTDSAAPAVTIRDQPRFPWRGLMIDVSRHFVPLDVLKRNLDGMEAVKMNVFHWHLSENQGFRVESKKFPKLHEMGSDGLYYTQDEIRDLIAMRATAAFASCRSLICRATAPRGSSGIPSSRAVRVPTKSSANGAFSILRWIPPTRKPTNFSTN